METTPVDDTIAAAQEVARFTCLIMGVRKNMKRTGLFLSLALALSGCVSHQKAKIPSGESANAKWSSLADFAGTFENFSLPTENGRSKALSPILSRFTEQEIKADRVVLSIPAPKTLVATTYSGSVEISRYTFKQGDDFSIAGGQILWTKGKTGIDPYFVAGSTHYSGYFYITKSGDLAYRSSSTFVGVGLLLIPKIDSKESISIWKSQK
jgi:hypothetical protein